jgi:hypothetical protein
MREFSMFTSYIFKYLEALYITFWVIWSHQLSSHIVSCKFFWRNSSGLPWARRTCNNTSSLFLRYLVTLCNIRFCLDNFPKLRPRRKFRNRGRETQPSEMIGPHYSTPKQIPCSGSDVNLFACIKIYVAVNEIFKK